MNSNRYTPEARRSRRLGHERGAVGTEMAIIVAIVVAIAIAVGAAMTDTANDRIVEISPAGNSANTN